MLIGNKFMNRQVRGFATKNDGANFKSGMINLGLAVFVREKYACLIHRFQKYDRLMQPGFNFKIPFVDSVEYVHDLREQVIEISSQVAVTKDNVALHIDGVLYIEIVDPQKASYNVENIYSAITNLAQTTMRSEIGKLTLDKTFEERETLNQNIIKSISKETKDWGISALRYEIKDIEPPSNIQKSMILQAEAERRKRASILTSEGDKLASINVSEAEKKAAVLKAEGAAESMIIQAEASSQALNQIDQALKQQGGLDAAQFLMGQRYIQAYAKLASKDNTIVLPAEPIRVQEQVSKSLHLMQGSGSGYSDKQQQVNQ
ncbi:band 7 family protein [Stylonychia lemnae]|uniref:Band 7 family protein n=1 Tax=Stylonychia lemnae TaxID=5949 RepID=A0A078A4T2_STYLE|nr:band 7 family protein [Stylonychia lemnae]|eukprot:CDW77187.1 band 7 family protein [Stylonychia lemnae]